MVRVIAEAMFEEPDHSAELEAQQNYEGLRHYSTPPMEEAYPTDEERYSWAWAYEGITEVEQPPGSHPATCTTPSHQPWAVEMFGQPRDYYTGEGCTYR